ncbi:MAG: M3 family metallopeptidase [Gammaproteobacteria bacterium]|nr:M3 family metallopeptidase [Gammaproteobacteria bacterium]NNF60893.1 M3 family metallopeptidase [Gammaproteobacteria bacterium]
MSNPLTAPDHLPRFSEILPEHVEPAVDEVLEASRRRIAELVAAEDHSWASLIAPLEQLEHWLSKTWSPVSHLNSVRNDESLRASYNRCLPKLSDYETEIKQNDKLYQAWRSVQSNDAGLDPVQQRLIELSLRSFRLAGVALADKDKQRFKALMQDLSSLQAKFEENLLDATNAWSCHVTDRSRLAGVPDRALLRAAAEAKSRGKGGWVFTLDYPAYQAISAHAESAPLREEMYTAWVTRASDQGPDAGRWDNTATMEKILAARHEAAGLLGYDNYAEYSLATKMAESVEQVSGFLRDLASRSRDRAAEEFAELEHFAGHRLNAWDVGFYSEQLRRSRFSISDEELRPYFPVGRVMSGMFEVVQQLYGVEVRERKGVDTWHADVRFFDVHAEDGQVCGSFYVDLYARPAKRGGAWMDDCVGRNRSNGESVNPVAYLSCNFMPPVGNAPALLTHDEVVTLFHEFGHVLHHILTRIDYPSVAGINGVAWDAVELPSQFMENFCWSEHTFDMISGHYQTDEPLPDEMFDRLVGSRSFQAGMQMVRQLEFALFDLRVHAEYDPAQGGRIRQILDEVRNEVAVVPCADFNRFPNGFAHVFGGGYAAGYYSYKWAEVLSADAFALFDEKGVLDADTGRHFLRSILQRGGAVDPMQAFMDFRGRKPDIAALLYYSGIAE